MSNNTAFIFPGQGAQYPGMREKLGALSPRQREIFSMADEALGFSLSHVMDSGPEEELTATPVAQPALLAMAIAHADALERAGMGCSLVMGHSLGEYSALVYAGAIEFTDAIKLVRKRGELMAQAVVNSPGKMAAVMKADLEKLGDAVRRASVRGTVEITNFNSPSQLVLSGESDAVLAAIEIINSEKIGRALELRVSAPFHSSLMKPAAEKFSVYLEETPISPPRLSFIDNVTASLEKDPLEIRKKLLAQLYMPVRWQDCVNTAIGLGINCFVECGPGSTLTGLVKRINGETRALYSEKIISEV